jgi:hypothetical protein
VASSELPTFDQDVVDACAAISISNATELVTRCFTGHTNFFDWYNATFLGVAAMQQRYPSTVTPQKNSRFTAFWNQIPVVFDQASITAIEFCALMAVSIEETGGNMWAAPEEMNGLNHPHPGLAYGFDAIPNLKQSYNHAPNLNALALFQENRFTTAHGALAGAQSILGRPGGIDPRWSGEVWPSDVPANVDEQVNGFVMQADFYKFRGRGVIQTTWRSDYKFLVQYILSVQPAQSQALANLGAKWRAATQGLQGAAQVEAIATISTNSDWDTAFGESLLLAKGVEIDSTQKNNYLKSLARTANLLDAADRKQRGALLYFAAHINGGSYPDRVAPMMKALMCGIAKTVGASSASPGAPAPVVAATDPHQTDT